MFFIELFVSGDIPGYGRRHVAERLGSLHELSAGGERLGDAGADVIRNLSQVVVHEPDVWVAAERALGPADRPRYVVRVYVPGPWRCGVVVPLGPEAVTLEEDGALRALCCADCREGYVDKRRKDAARRRT
jgi:hypothetical protein